MRDKLRRELQFASLKDTLAESERLLTLGYSQNGNWTLGQILRHLRLVQDPSIDGYPRWMSLFAPLRPIMRRLLLPKLLSPNSPKGIPTSAPFKPHQVEGDQAADDAKEFQAFAESVRRFQEHQGEFYPHPGFGKLDRQRLEQVHAAHAAHHLGFLSPNES